MTYARTILDKIQEIRIMRGFLLFFKTALDTSTPWQDHIRRDQTTDIGTYF